MAGKTKRQTARKPLTVHQKAIAVREIFKLAGTIGNSCWRIGDFPTLEKVFMESRYFDRKTPEEVVKIPRPLWKYASVHWRFPLGKMLPDRISSKNAKPNEVRVFHEIILTDRGAFGWRGAYKCVEKSMEESTVLSRRRYFLAISCIFYPLTLVALRQIFESMPELFRPIIKTVQESAKALADEASEIHLDAGTAALMMKHFISRIKKR